VTEKILCVDDDPHVLQAWQRQLRRQFHIETAQDPQQALEAVANRGPYAVIVSDMRMPGMDGIRFLARAKALSPDSVRIMLTGYSDQATAIQAVNEGSIFRFLTKPCPPETLTKALAAALEQYRLVTAEKELLEKTLRGSIKVLTDVLSLVNPAAFGRASRVRRVVSQLCKAMNVDKPWQLEIAAMLSQIGCVTLPQETVDKLYRGERLSPEESQMVEAHPSLGRDLVANIPRLEAVGEIIAYQEKRFNGGGIPADSRAGEEIPLGARILKVALDFDTLQSKGLAGPEALQELRQRPGWYDPDVLRALETVVGIERDLAIQEVRIPELATNMILAEDVRTTSGLLLVSKGQEVTPSLRQRLKNFAKKVDIEEPIRVVVRPPPGRGGQEEARPCSSVDRRQFHGSHSVTGG